MLAHDPENVLRPLVIPTSQFERSKRLAMDLRDKWRLHNDTASAGQNRSATRPEDIVHLYSALQQILQDILALPGVEEDDDMIDTLNARQALVRAHRCYFLAETYLINSKVVCACIKHLHLLQ